MEAQQVHSPARTDPDPAKYLIPIILGIGTIALFALPTVSFTDTGGYQVQVGFSDARGVLASIGYNWVLYVSALGVLMSFAGALFLTPESTQFRNSIMGLGALIALAFPFYFFSIQT